MFLVPKFVPLILITRKNYEINKKIIQEPPI